MSVRVRISVETSENDIEVVRAPIVMFGGESEEVVVIRELMEAVRQIAKFYEVEVKP